MWRKSEKGGGGGTKVRECEVVVSSAEVGQVLAGGEAKTLTY
jgi:hypothetical protein